MAIQDTLFSIVNTWECDEKGILNVRFYFSRFEEADRQFRLMTGFSESLAGARRVRHVRAHKELTAGTLLTMRSYVAFDGPHMLTVVHELYDTSENTLVATAIDGYTPNPDSVKVLRGRFKDIQEPMQEVASPKGLAASPANPRLSFENVMSSGAKITHRSTVLPRDIGPDGRADDDFFVSCLADATPHIWETTPMTRAWLKEKSYDRTSAEMKLTWVSPLKAGDTVVVASGLTGVQEHGFTLRHHMFESRTNRLVAICDAVAIVLDLETRHAVALDAGAKEAISRLKID